MIRRVIFSMSRTKSIDKSQDARSVKDISGHSKTKINIVILIVLLTRTIRSIDMHDHMSSLLILNFDKQFGSRDCK